MEKDFGQFLNDLKSRLLVSEVVSPHVPLKRQGREWKGLSPFTNEKTPSFTVNDQKQFWHCFSSGEHGDVISFLMKTQNKTFMEAVEELADRAGLEVPRTKKQDPKQKEKLKHAGEALAAARAFYQQALAQDKQAQAYLTDRGLSTETIKAFQLGVAPAKGDSLKQHLLKQGFRAEVLLEAGLLIQPEKGDTFDRFRKRIMFPIDNRKEDIIGFGARALDSKAQAKYLNSPETPLFHKGENFYGVAKAAKPAYEKGRLVIVEGYMDVIALHQAGCDDAVASLGTALTEQQIALAWRLVDEPIICLDGDEAGQRAAMRVIERALKILQPGKSLRFAYMPRGRDPDDVVRTAGLEAFEQHLAQAEPMSETLFYKEASSASLETPERRAALRQRFDKLINEIPSPEVQRYYRDLFHRRLEQIFWNRDRSERITTSQLAAPVAAPAFAPDGKSGRERILLGLLLDRPDLFKKHTEDLEKIYFAAEPHQHLRDALLMLNEEERLQPDWTGKDFYENLDQAYHHLLDIIYGQEGARFYNAFPAFHPQLLPQHPEGFAEKCLACFIHEQYHQALKRDCQKAYQTYQEHFSNDQAESQRDHWLSLKTFAEEDEQDLFYEIADLHATIDELAGHLDYASGFSLGK